MKGMFSKMMRGIATGFFLILPTVLLAADIPGPKNLKLENPLGPETDTLIEFLTKILEIMLIFAIPIIVLFIIYAGFLYVTAQGDEGKIRTAHSALTWSVVGGVIILAAKLIVDVIQATVKSI